MHAVIKVQGQLEGDRMAQVYLWTETNCCQAKGGDNQCSVWMRQVPTVQAILWSFQSISTQMGSNDPWTEESTTYPIIREMRFKRMRVNIVKRKTSCAIIAVL